MTEGGLSAADWLSLEDAVDRVLALAEPLEPEVVGLRGAVGRVLAEGVTSPVDHPPWDNSAMDGFAARSQDVADASAESPVILELVDDIPAGGFPGRRIGPGQAAKIMTGAPVPDGADSVVRVEHTDAWRSDGWAQGGQPRVSVLAATDAGRNVRRRGEDLRRGEEVLAAGSLLRPAEVGVLASVGRTEVRVRRRPRVALLSNGDELVEPEAFAEVLAGRRIVNSNAYALAAAVAEAGGEADLLGIARDDEEDLEARVSTGLDADVLVTTAGAAVGEHDLVKRVLGRMGFRFDFWRVRVRPGSPLSFGRLEREGRRPLWTFGLPGNPVSAVATFLVLVRPFLLRLQGRTAVLPPALVVRALEPIRSSPDKVQLLRVRLLRDDRGWGVRLTGPQGSGILTSLTTADALLIVPEGRRGLKQGEEGLAIPLRPPEEWSEPLSFSGPA